MTNIPNAIQCAKDKLCCLVDAAGQTIKINRRDGVKVYLPDSPIGVEGEIEVYSGKAIVQKPDPSKGLLGINTKDIAHENVTHELVVYICPDDIIPIEKKDRVIYRSEEYEVETVLIEDPRDIPVYYKLLCVKIEDD